MIKKLFGEKEFWKAMLPLALPVAIQNLLSSSFTLVDTLMVGRLGDVSLAAVGMAGQWSWLLNMVIFGVCSGASVFLAQYFGERNREGVVRTYGVAVVTGLFASLVFMLIALFAPRTVISIFNRTPEVLEAGVSYLTIAAFSYPAIMLNLLANIVLRSTKRVKLPMYVAVVTTVLNAFLDYGFIFGAFGLPALGVRGAAIATVISAWSGPVIIYGICALLRDEIFFAPLKEILGFPKVFVKQFFGRAVPVVLNEFLWGLGTVVYNAIFSNMGYEYTAAVSILRTFENIAFAFFIGFNSAACVMIGNDIGRGDIREGVNKSKRFMFIIPFAGLIAGGIMLLLREPLIGLFNSGGAITETTLSAAYAIMLIYCVELAFRNVPYVAIVGVFRSGGDTKTGMKLDLLTLWCISIPITLLAAFVFKLPFALVFALSYVCEDYLKAFLCIRYFHTNKWIHPVTDSGKAALSAYLQEEEQRKRSRKKMRNR